VPTSASGPILDRLAGEPRPSLVYARLKVTPGDRFGTVRASAYFPDTNGPIPVLEEPAPSTLDRAIFRGSAGSDFGKSLRWFAEARIQPLLLPEFVSRNRLLIETPDRNQTVLQALLTHLAPTTRLSISLGLTLPGGFSRTATVAQWRQQAPTLSDRMPAVFALLGR
jgi:hypothetical protein